MADRSTTIGKSFQARADSAAFWESWVAAKLSRGGLWVVHHPFTLSTETGRPIASYAESVDLTVHNSVAGVDVEVKSVNLSFDSPETYPHEDVLVCSEKSWNNKWSGKYTIQRNFLLVSRQTGDIVWLCKGVTVWAKPVTDHTRNESYQCMVAHKGSLSSFASFVVHAQLLGDGDGESNQTVSCGQDSGHVHRDDPCAGCCPGPCSGRDRGAYCTPRADESGSLGGREPGDGGQVLGVGNVVLRTDGFVFGPVPAEPGRNPVPPRKAGKAPRRP